MSAETWIAAGLFGGALFVWWRSRQQRQQSVDACTAACSLVPQSGQAACLVACKALAGLGGAINDAATGRADVTNAAAIQAQWQAENDALNGAPKYPYDTEAARTFGNVQLADPVWANGGQPPGGVGLDPVQSSVVQYGNDCTPFAGSPGWGSCAPGTHSMTLRDIFASFGSTRDKSNWGNAPYKPAAPTVAQEAAGSITQPDFSLLGTGGAIPGSPGARDPLMYGPDNSGTMWMVGGRGLTCPQGQAPAIFSADGSPVTDHRSGALDNFRTVGCSPGGVGGWQAGTYDGTDGSGRTPVAGNGTSSGPTSEQSIGCPPPAGFTWDTSNGGFWRRMRAGEVQNLGPCKVSIAGVPVASVHSYTGKAVL